MKDTKPPGRPGYDHFCAVACALDLIGDRWALLIVRELLFSGKRFTDLHAGLPGIGTNTLTTRLAELEESGILLRKKLPPPLGVTMVELTARGRALEPVLVALARWGTVPLMAQKPRHGLRPPWLGLALRTFFDEEGAQGPPIRVAVKLPLGTLCLSLENGALHITEGELPQPADLRITTSEKVLLDILRGALNLASAKRKRVLKLEGEVALFPRLLSAFPIGRRGPRVHAAWE